jgi:hypothetical protein
LAEPEAVSFICTAMPFCRRVKVVCRIQVENSSINDNTIKARKFILKVMGAVVMVFNRLLAFGGE